MLKVLKAGFYTTIQDNGRFGFRAYGVPVSGAMDAYSSQYANLLLGNGDNSALLEMTMVGGSFKFSEPTLICVSGANMDPCINSQPIKQNSAVEIKANDILSFGRAVDGFRTYLAVKGGLKTDRVVGSRSQFMPITTIVKIRKDDIFKYNTYNKSLRPNATIKYDSSVLTNQILEAYVGPEFKKLTTSQKEALIHSEFKVSKLNNRMAYQLKPTIENKLEPILTSPVLPGTVQLTPKGNLIVLMRDAQTTGGYPRVLQLTEKAINGLSQKSTGSSFKIRLKDF